MGFFYISAPLLEKSRDATIREIRELVLRKNVADGREITIERNKFKLANLDTLMLVNDKLLKLQSNLESLLKKIDKQYLDLQQKQSHDWYVKGIDREYPISKFLYEFRWNQPKYPRSFPINRIAQTLEVKLTNSQNEFRKKINSFNETKVQLSQNTQKQGNYYVKDLTDLLAEPNVSSEDFIYSKFITTLVLVVPVSIEEQFVACYEFFTENVVPKSAKKLTRIPEKDGLGIWRVMIFLVKVQNDEDEGELQDEEIDAKQKQKREHKRNLPPVNEFIEIARQKMKIVVKEFKFEPKMAENRKKKKEDLQESLKIQAKSLSDICLAYFSEIYELYLHAKILRLIIQTNMRFGNDPTVFYLIETVPNKEKYVQMILIEIFGDKESQGLYGTKDQIDDGEDFFPFIYVPALVI